MDLPEPTSVRPVETVPAEAKKPRRSTWWIVLCLVWFLFCYLLGVSLNRKLMDLNLRERLQLVGIVHPPTVLADPTQRIPFEIDLDTSDAWPSSTDTTVGISALYVSASGEPQSTLRCIRTGTATHCVGTLSANGTPFFRVWITDDSRQTYCGVATIRWQGPGRTVRAVRSSDGDCYFRPARDTQPP